MGTRWIDSAGPRVIVAASVSLLLGGAMACASDDASGGDAAMSKPLSGMEVEAAANDLLGSVLAFNALTSSEYLRLQTELESDRYALVDALSETLQTMSGEPLLQLARDEVLEQMNLTEEDALAGTVRGLVDIFDELSENARNALADSRFALFLDEAATTSGRIQDRLNLSGSGDAKTAYHFAPVFNLLTSMRVVGWATLGVPGAIYGTYHKAYIANAELVGSDDGEGDSLLIDYIDERDRRNVSKQTKLDSDPMVNFIRRTLDEQQRILE